MSYLTLSFMSLICLVKNEIHGNIQMPLLSINVTMKKSHYYDWSEQKEKKLNFSVVWPTQTFNWCPWFYLCEANTKCIDFFRYFLLFHTSIQIDNHARTLTNIRTHWSSIQTCTSSLIGSIHNKSDIETILA